MAVRLCVIASARTPATRLSAFPRPTEPAEHLPAARPMRVAEALAGPETRCLQTARALGHPAVPAPELADLAAGAWIGRATEDLLATEPDFPQFLSATDTRPPGGESAAEVIRRARMFLGDKEFADGRTLLVVAPLVVRAITVALLDLPAPTFHRIDVEPLGTLSFDRHGGRWRLRVTDPERR